MNISIIMAVVPVLAVLAIAIVALYQMADPSSVKEVLILAITSIGSMTTGGAVGYVAGKKRRKEDAPPSKRGGRL